MFERECTGIQTLINLENSDEADMHHAFDEITKIRNTVSSEVKNNVRESQKKQVLQYPRKRVKQGDDMMVFNARKFTRKGSKMERKKTWKGPYKVINITEKGVATLEKKGVPLKVKYKIKLLKKICKT